jgi:Fe2+ or Zn2+ uptake regulation protein
MVSRLHGRHRVTDTSTPSGDRPEDGDDAMRAALLGYLSEHPRAMDSLEGVVDWWLPRHAIRISVERVARTLEALAREGLLERIQDGKRVRYRLRGGEPPHE